MQEIDKKVAALKAQYEYIDYNEMLFRQYSDMYIEQRIKDLIDNNGLTTIESYELTLTTHITPVIGSYKLVDINKSNR